MNTEIANAVNAAGDKAQYDTRVKRLLAQKSILAHILVKTVDEFKGMKPEDVVKYIEGEPSISVVPVEPGLANIRDFALKNKSPCSACEFQAKQGISILGIKLLFFSV